MGQMFSGWAVCYSLFFAVKFRVDLIFQIYEPELRRPEQTTAKRVLSRT